MAKLTDQTRTFIVQALACFDSPATVADAVKREFGIVIPRQNIERWDPTKKAGAALTERWRLIFDETRKAFLEDTSKIGISHRAVRLRTLQRLADRAEETRNLALTAQLVEQAAKEVGDAFTNRRQLSGPGGGPIPLIATTMTAKEAAEAYGSTIDGNG